MRINSSLKYKSYFQSKKVVVSPQLRILKFKRSKWKICQEIIKKKLLFFFLKKNNLEKHRKIKNSFRDNYNIKIKTNFWGKLRTMYKTSLQTKRIYKQIFDNVLDIKKLTKLQGYSQINSFRSLLVKPYFKLDILLYKLKFFNSGYEAQQAIYSGCIYINNKCTKSSTYLKKGDIVSIRVNKSYLFTQKVINNRSILCKTSIFFNFIETDYYTKTFIVLKDLNELSKEDFYLFNLHYFNLKFLD